MKRLLTLSVLSLGLAFAGAVEAGTVSTTLNISGTYQSACDATTTAVNFGTFSATNPTYANGDVTVTCSSGLPYHIALDAGGPIAASGGRTLGGLQTLSYLLAKDSTFNTPWGDSDFANTYPYGSSLADTGNGASQPHTVYGGLYPLSGYQITPGTYASVVNVTVYY